MTMTMPEKILQLQSLSDKIKGDTINKSHARYLDEIIGTLTTKHNRIADLEIDNARLRDALEFVQEHMYDEKPLPDYVCNLVKVVLT